MSKEERLDGAQPQKIDIFYELPPSPQGAHQYERAGAVVHGDASGEWTLDEDGEVEDIVFFASPRLMGYGHKEKGRSEQRRAPVCGHRGGAGAASRTASSRTCDLA